MPVRKSKSLFASKSLLALAIIPIAIFLIWLIFFNSPYIKRFDPVKPSSDQKELINSFGYPDVFSVSMDSEVRYEIWTYYDAGRSFVFLNGTFVQDQTIEKLSEDFQFPDFRPTQFKAGMTLKQVKKTLGDPTAEADINSELIEGAKIYDYWDQVKIGTKDNQITYVEILPVFIPEEFRIKDEKTD